MNELDNIFEFIHSHVKDNNLYGINNELEEIFKCENIFKCEGESDKHKEIYILKEIQSKIPEFKIVDWTDLNDSRCYEFKILLTKGQDILDDDEELLKALGGTRRDMYVFISRIINYYYIFVEKTEFDREMQTWIFTREIFNDKTSIEVKDKLKELMNKLGYNYLKDDIAKRYLRNVKTEFIEADKVRVFHYLFTEFEELYDKKIVVKAN